MDPEPRVLPASDLRGIGLHEFHRWSRHCRPEGQRAEALQHRHFVHQIDSRDARGQIPHPAQRDRRERHHPDPAVGTVSEPVTLQRLHQYLLGVSAVTSGVLGLDGQLQRARRRQRHLQQLRQGQDVVPAAQLIVGVPPGTEVVLLQLTQGLVRHAPPAGARPIDSRVVDTHQVPVGSEPHIALQPVRAGVDRRTVRGGRVFGGQQARPAMRHDGGIGERGGHGLRIPHGGQRCLVAAGPDPVDQVDSW